MFTFLGTTRRGYWRRAKHHCDATGSTSDREGAGRDRSSLIIALRASMAAATLLMAFIPSASIAAIISFSDINRSPSFNVSGEDWYFTLTLASTDQLHAGDDLRISFLPWVGRNETPIAAIVEQFQSESGETLPPCTSPPYTCAHTNGFAESPSTPSVSVETAFTPLSPSEFDALNTQCPACARPGFGNVGFVQPTFMFAATSDVAGPIENLAFFLARFVPVANTAPFRVMCPEAQLFNATGDLLLDSLGTSSLDIDCDMLVSEPHVLGNIPLPIMLLGVGGGGAPQLFPLPPAGQPLPQCLRGQPETRCGFVVVASVPEPATWQLLIVNAAMLILLGRRRRYRGRSRWSATRSLEPRIYAVATVVRGGVMARSWFAVAMTVFPCLCVEAQIMYDVRCGDVVVGQVAARAMNFPPQGTDPGGPGVGAAFVPTPPFNTTSAAASCGEDHFNWLQIGFTNVPPVDMAGDRLGQFFLDPPFGGYSDDPDTKPGNETRWADQHLYYFDEGPDRPPPGVPGTTHILDATRPDALFVEDIPGGDGVFNLFATFLVSVNADLTLDSFHGGWVWFSDNLPGPGIPDVGVLFSLPEQVHPSGFEPIEIEQFFRSAVFPVSEADSFVLTCIALAALVFCPRRFAHATSRSVTLHPF